MTAYQATVEAWLLVVLPTAGLYVGLLVGAVLGRRERGDR